MGGKGTKRAGRERKNNNESLTTRACEKTAAGKSVSDHLPAGMHDSVFFKGSSPAERLLSSQHSNKATAMALFECLECSCVHRGSTRTTRPRLHQGREHIGLTSSQTSPQIEKQSSVATTGPTGTSHYLMTEVIQQRAALCLTASE